MLPPRLLRHEYSIALGNFVGLIQSGLVCGSRRRLLLVHVIIDVVLRLRIVDVLQVRYSVFVGRVLWGAFSRRFTVFAGAATES